VVTGYFGHFVFPFVLSYTSIIAMGVTR